MSTGANLRKDRCRTPKSLSQVESWAILSLRLRVRVLLLRSERREPSGGHPTGNPEVEIGGALGRGLGQHARRRAPFRAPRPRRNRTPVRDRSRARRQPRVTRSSSSIGPAAGAGRAPRSAIVSARSARRSVSFGPTAGLAQDEARKVALGASRRAAGRPEPVTGIRRSPRSCSSAATGWRSITSIVIACGKSVFTRRSSTDVKDAVASRSACSRTCSVVISRAAVSSAARTRSPSEAVTPVICTSRTATKLESRSHIQPEVASTDSTARPRPRRTSRRLREVKVIGAELRPRSAGPFYKSARPTESTSPAPIVRIRSPLQLSLRRKRSAVAWSRAQTTRLPPPAS